MKNLKVLLTIMTFTLFFLALSSPAALATNIVIDKQAGPAGPGLFYAPDYANDSACIQEALNNSKSGDTITIRRGDYYITKEIYQTNKSLNIIGEGKVTLHIQTPDRGVLKELNQEILFNGSLITSKNLSVNAKKGSSQVVLTDASQVRQNDLIKIWKNIQWCPLVCPDNYPDQMTGEMYAVKNVNGNVVTLNQPLLRDYSLSENVQTEVYRPIQIHIKNIKIQDTGETMLHHGLVLQYCKDSSVTDSWFNNSGFGAICLYSCFNVSINNNEIYNSTHSNCGYGVNVASGSALVNIDHNHIENCRHAITGNSDERKSLNRDVVIADNTLKGANVRGSWVVDAHAVTINFVVTRNKIYPQLPYFAAFSDGTQQSTFSNNEIFGGYGGIFKRGGVNDGVHIYENNTFNGISGYMYRGGFGTDNKLIIRNNTQNKGINGVYFPYKGSFRNILINDNIFSNLSQQGVYQKFLINGINLNISNNTFANIKLEGIYIDGNSFKNGIVKIQNNTLINVNTSNSSSGITIKNIQNATISGNQILKNQAPKVPLAAFSASPTSGYTPLTVNFTDRSTGSPTLWNWSFGDGTYSTQKNPAHTYSKAGNYTVILTASNSAGNNRTMKSSYINVRTAATAQKPIVSFWASRTSGKAPLSLGFTDASTGSPTAWKWNFGDGTYSTVQKPRHTYSKAGTYTVTLTASNTAGKVTKARANYIKVT
ncbi:PKD domain-containing protein [Methanosarcina sp.]|uniref:PKD domain-containing protein n=1 Tax=Methanosarcina sp. TaxID=2213 RepID=UPI003BB615CD